jgi:AP-2 complex subunit mu-1
VVGVEAVGVCVRGGGCVCVWWVLRRWVCVCVVVAQIRRFPGQMELGLTAQMELVSTTKEKKTWSRPPVNVEFQVPMFTASGLRVRFLKVWEKAGYTTVKWVRYVTRAGPSLGGSYDIRCS